MEEKLKAQLLSRINACLLSFANAHGLPLVGKVIKWDPWETETTVDITIRIEIDKQD